MILSFKNLTALILCLFTNFVWCQSFNFRPSNLKLCNGFYIIFQENLISTYLCTYHEILNVKVNFMCPKPSCKLLISFNFHLRNTWFVFWKYVNILWLCMYIIFQENLPNVITSQSNSKTLGIPSGIISYLLTLNQKKPLTHNTPLIHTSFTYSKLNMDEI